MYTAGPKPPFDVRDLIPGAEFDNDHLQARYDTANRMIILTGSIPFDRLLNEKWGVLLPEIADKVTDATDLALLRVRDDLPGLDVKSCFDLLSSQYPDLTWRNYAATSYKRRDANRDQQMDRLYDAHVALWQQGIYLPNPMSCSVNNAQQNEAIKTLVTTAGSRTHQGYYEHLRSRTSSDWSREEVTAVKIAIKAGVLFNVCPNDRCCFEGVCEGLAFGKCCFDCGDEDDPCEETPVPLTDAERLI